MEQKNYRRLFYAILLALLVAVLFRSFLFTSYMVKGKSMEPTLHDGDLVLVNKMVPGLSEVDRFDVIVFHADAEDDYVKRIIGLPGDEIEYRKDRLYINGKYVSEKYLHLAKKKSDYDPYTADFSLEDITGRHTVPEGYLFVMGDNRPNSVDSRTFGLVADNQLVGKVGLRYWPLTQAELDFK